MHGIRILSRMGRAVRIEEQSNAGAKIPLGIVGTTKIAVETRWPESDSRSQPVVCCTGHLMISFIVREDLLLLQFQQHERLSFRHLVLRRRRAQIREPLQTGCSSR